MESFEAIKQPTKSIVLELVQNITHDEFVENMDSLTLNLDSINAIRLIFKLQEKFGIVFDDNEISFDNFYSLAKITELVDRKKRLEYALV